MSPPIRRGTAARFGLRKPLAGYETTDDGVSWSHFSPGTVMHTATDVYRTDGLDGPVPRVSFWEVP